MGVGGTNESGPPNACGNTGKRGSKEEKKMVRRLIKLEVPRIWRVGRITAKVVAKGGSAGGIDNQRRDSLRAPMSRRSKMESRN